MDQHQLAAIKKKIKAGEYVPTVNIKVDNTVLTCVKIENSKYLIPISKKVIDEKMK